MEQTRKIIEDKIVEEMKWLNTSILEIADFKANGTKLSPEAKRFIALAVLPCEDRLELAKAMRLRIRLFGSTRFTSLPKWVMEHARERPEGLDRRIVERLRADLCKKVGFTDMNDAF